MAINSRGTSAEICSASGEIAVECVDNTPDKWRFHGRDPVEDAGELCSIQPFPFGSVGLSASSVSTENAKVGISAVTCGGDEVVGENGSEVSVQS